MKYELAMVKWYKVSVNCSPPILVLRYLHLFEPSQGSRKLFIDVFNFTMDNGRGFKTGRFAVSRGLSTL